MFNFRWTPFQLLSLVSFTLVICEFIAIAKLKGDPGLGGLAPMIYAGFGAGFMVVDIIFQAIFRNYKNIFFVVEVVLLLAFVVWMYSIGGM